jgi:hypothetical protein
MCAPLNQTPPQAVAQLKREFFRNSTIPPGTVSVHVRRGAKTAIGEMRAVPDLVYFQYAQALRNGDKQLLKQSVFVSTEDPTAVKWFDKNATGWQVLYTTVPRDNHHGGAAVSHMLYLLHSC